MKQFFIGLLILSNIMSARGDSVDSLQIEEAGLPIVVIETVNGEWPSYKMAHKSDPSYLGNTIGESTKVPGRVYIRYKGKIVYDSHEYVKDSCGMTIKIRGNTSVISVKKPYKIKLQKKADMLFRGDDSIYKDKNWILIKDKKLRNRVGYKINELAKLQWTPEFRYVNVIINGSYEGLYILMESVKRNNKCRLKVSDTGFIAEYDPYFWNENVYVKSKINRLPMHYTFKYPDSEEITQEQLDYFEGYIDKVETALFNESFSDYIDVESFARWMLAHDILGNNDGAGANIYFTKYDDSPDSKLMMANLWDMDGIMMNKDKWDEIHRLGIFYYDYLFGSSNNYDFKRMYKNIWENEKDDIFDKIQSFLDEYGTSEEGIALNKSIALDNIRWDDYNVGVDESIAIAKEWFTSRKEWMDKAVNDIVVGIETISADETNHAPMFYNLQGQRLNTPPAKGIYIQKTNRNKSRVIYHQK